MNWKGKLQGGTLAFVGFMLSPLSWWNDLVVNVPLAVGFGWLVSLAWRPAFEAAVIVGYLLTNVLGLVLMQKGARRMLSAEVPPYSRRDLLRDLVISLLYTAFIVALMKWQVIQPITSCFTKS